MSGFSNHNIVHTSPSSINMWAACPGAWVARYVLGRKFKFGLAAKAGVLAEEAVVNVLANGWTLDAAIEAAIGEYNKASAFGCTDAESKRGEAIRGMITQAVEELAQYGEPEFDTDIANGKKQRKIEMLCNGDGWKLPVIGFLDFVYPKHGLVVDLKTTMRLPSEMSFEHLRQGAIYRQAMGNYGVKFMYVSGKGIKIHDIPETSGILAETKAILNRQERFLRLGDAETLRAVVPVNAASFYWSDDALLRQELYGI
jgi:hypothetical protein